MKIKKGYILTACVAAALLVLWLILKPSGKQQLTLETARVSRITIVNSVTATGTVEPVTEVEVGTQVSGIIDKLYVDYNDEVKAGQVIAEMDRVTLQAELESAQSTLASSKTEYEYRLKEYNRAKALHEKELVSEADYDLAEYNYQKALNAYKQSQASMVKVRRNLGYATITSPIDGVVISRAVEEGQTVAAGFNTPTLFVIAKDLTKIQVIAAVDEADIGQVKEGQGVEFTVDAYPDDVFAGQVQQVRLEPTTTSNVVTYEVVITADNPELKLKPGLTASVTINTLCREDVLSVPTKALRFTPDPAQMGQLGIRVEGNVPQGKCVWIKDGDVIRPAAVETGSTMNDRTEVTGGVQAFQALEREPVDVLFCDIQMPGLSGMELSRMLPEGTRVIFTTAFGQYALEGFKVQALDYLLKPISYADFLSAARKAQEWFSRPAEPAPPAPQSIFVKTEYRLQQIAFDDILYVEGMKDYVRIFLESGATPVVSLSTLKALEAQLPSDRFFRVGKSHIVQLSKVRTLERGRIVFGTVYIPISEGAREAFYQALSRYSLLPKA